MKKWNLKAILGGDFCEASGGREQCLTPHLTLEGEKAEIKIAQKKIKIADFR